MKKILFGAAMASLLALGCGGAAKPTSPSTPSPAPTSHEAMMQGGAGAHMAAPADGAAPAEPTPAADPGAAPADPAAAPADPAAPAAAEKPAE